MRFGETLIEKMTQEWKSEYISYGELKAMLIGGPEKMENQKEDPNENFIMFELEFLKECKRNLDKVNKFYLKKIKEIRSELRSLKQYLHEIRRQMSENEKNKNSLTSTKKEIYLNDKMKSLKSSFCDTRFSIALVQKYQHLNVTGFRKILKKHDKLWKNTRGDNWNQEHVLKSAIVTSGVLDQQFIIELIQIEFELKLIDIEIELAFPN